MLVYFNQWFSKSFKFNIPLNGVHDLAEYVYTEYKCLLLVYYVYLCWNILLNIFRAVKNTAGLMSDYCPTTFCCVSMCWQPLFDLQQLGRKSICFQNGLLRVKILFYRYLNEKDFNSSHNLFYCVHLYQVSRTFSPSFLIR